MSDMTAIVLALQTFQADVGAGFDQVEKEIETARGLGAASSAMSMVDFHNTPGWQLGFGAIIERDEYNPAVAAGLAYVYDRFTVNAKVGVSENKEVVGGLGMTIALGGN